MLSMLFKKKDSIIYKITYVNEELQLNQEEFLEFLNHCNEEGTYSNIIKIEGVKND